MTPFSRLKLPAIKNLSQIRDGVYHIGKNVFVFLHISYKATMLFNNYRAHITYIEHMAHRRTVVTFLLNLGQKVFI